MPWFFVEYLAASTVKKVAIETITNTSVRTKLVTYDIVMPVMTENIGGATGIVSHIFSKPFSDFSAVNLGLEMITSMTLANRMDIITAVLASTTKNSSALKSVSQLPLPA